MKKSEDRRPKTEDRSRKTEDGSQKTEDRSRNSKISFNNSYGFVLDRLASLRMKSDSKIPPLKSLP